MPRSSAVKAWLKADGTLAASAVIIARFNIILFATRRGSKLTFMARLLRIVVGFIRLAFTRLHRVRRESSAERATGLSAGVYVFCRWTFEGYFWEVQDFPECFSRTPILVA